MLPASSCGYAREASESCPSTIKIRVWNQRLRSPSLIRPRIAFPHLRSRSREHKLRGARLRVLFFLVSIGTRALRAVCRRKAELVMENLALRQQVTALKKERPRPPLDDVDRAFWVALRASWPGWAGRLVIVNADTVARWHRERFRRYWANISKRRYPGRPRVDAEIRELIRKMAKDSWGAPRIHAELMKLGFAVSEMTVSRYMPRRPVEPDQVKRWMAFLRNHRHDIAAMDLFTVPTASLRLLFGFFLIEHGRRHIVHFNATFKSDSSVGDAATAQRISVRQRTEIPDFRSRLHLQPGRRRVRQGAWHRSRSHLVPKPLAKRNDRALDRELPARDPQARRSLRRAPSRAARALVYQLLPRGQMPLEPRQRHT